MASILGSRATATEALRNVDLSGKTAVVTGGNAGIGVETVRALAQAGAKVILTSRRVSAGEEVAAKLKSDGVKGALEVQQLDLADLSSVRELAKQLSAEASIDIVILNAGVAFSPLTYTKDNLELHIATNHFGHFLLVELLLDKLKHQETPVRIVAVASQMHQTGFDIDDLHWRRRPYSKWAAYAQSKLCNILFIKELFRRTAGTKVEAFSLHPGAIVTNGLQHLKVLKYVLEPLLYPFSKSLAQGAATSVYAATAPELTGKSGAYLCDCNISKPDAKGQDEELAKKLWIVTEQQLRDPATRT